MPVISLDYDDLISLMGLDVPIEDLVDKIPMIGSELERVEEKQIDVNFFPNRPDLYSVEGVSRALKGFFGIEIGLRKYDVKRSNVKIIVDESVESIRPFIVCAVIKGLKMTDALIKSLMDMQEKLHLTIGRKRKKVSIGVHDFSNVKAPFIYKAVKPSSIKFIPLGKTVEMNLAEVLQKHEKGMEYAPILENANVYPIILDSNDEVLSFPPIINGILTEVAEDTKALFIDITGTDIIAINSTLNIVCTALAERGGELYSVDVEYKDKRMTTPDLKPKTKKLEVKYTNSILGTDLSPHDMANCLGKMRYGTEIKKKYIEVSIPAYRNDILHPIDLVEDVAIGFGYENLESMLPKAMTFGGRIECEKFSKKLREIMIGLGFNETMTLALSGEKEQFKLMNLRAARKVTIKNPISEEYTCLRISLIPGLLGVLRENKHHELPQRIFEVGDVVIDTENKRNIAGLITHSKASFTEAKSLIENILRSIGVKYQLSAKKHNSFITGRCAAIKREDEEIGLFGELSPKVITNFELGYPVIGFEMDVNELIRTSAEVAKPGPRRRP